MVGNVFDYRSGRSIKNVNPQEVGEELERIRAETGALTPDSVLEAASEPDSPLHAAFEWDDSAAAKQHRLAQARRLIISIRVLNSPAGAAVPAYVSVRTPEIGRSYIPTVEALTDDEIQVRVMHEVKMALESIQRRWSSFQQAADLLESLKKQVG